jgi:hypothetical protein
MNGKHKDTLFVKRISGIRHRLIEAGDEQAGETGELAKSDKPEYK